ncbi:MAG: YceI family protein [Ktedonobacteraceae bacterium]
MAWEIDPAHSEVMFSVKHAMISTVRGHFNVISGHLHIDDQNPANSWVDAQANASSINTRDERHDGHLKSPDFFDAAQYPIITFKSSKVEHVGGTQYKVTGDLTMHGVTKQVTFDAEYNGQGKDAYGMQRAGISVKGKINREDWGLTWNAALEAGGVLVSKDVTIEIDLSAVNQPAAAPAS